MGNYLKNLQIRLLVEECKEIWERRVSSRASGAGACGLDTSLLGLIKRCFNYYIPGLAAAPQTVILIAVILSYDAVDHSHCLVPHPSYCLCMAAGTLQLPWVRFFCLGHILTHFWLWEEAVENPCRHWKNMQSEQKGLQSDQASGSTPFCCEVKV